MVAVVAMDTRIDFENKTLFVLSSGEAVPYIFVPSDRIPTMREVFAARDWLVDASHPGICGLLRTSLGYFYAISDPNVAMEFRLRFT